MTNPLKATAGFRALALCGALFGMSACRERAGPSAATAGAAPQAATSGGEVVDGQERARAAMVEEQIAARGVRDPEVLEALRRVPRHRFVPPELAHLAYRDQPLPIGLGQTISQPYIVALMSEVVRPRPGGRALDVGTGSGYQAAVLAELGMEVYGIEILCPLADAARERLSALGYTSVTVRCGDGYAGWVEHAPFDAIVVAAAAPEVPRPLLDQLAPGGRLVIPIGESDQRLMVYQKGADGGLTITWVESVVFVPMTGEVRKPTAP